MFIRLFLQITLGTSLVATAAPVKMSRSMICHTESSPWYDVTRTYVEYRNLDECLNDGGRLPRGTKGSVDTATRSASQTQYQREYFGEGGWADFDRDCQNTRAEILIELSTEPVRYRKDNNCTVDRGKWISPFTNRVHYKASELDVDHLFPLALAWERGAYAWDYEKRVAFANDPVNLWPVEANLNRSKGAKPISRWLPPTNQCEYVYRYTRVAKKYGLFLTDDDQLTLQNCKNGFTQSEGDTLLDLGIFKIRGNFDAKLGKN